MVSDEELDHSPMTFGQYKGQSPSQIAEHDPSWLVYIAEHSKTKVASDLLINDCKKELDS